MSVQDYMSALKLGKREYNACVNKGKYPYLRLSSVRSPLLVA